MSHEEILQQILVLTEDHLRHNYNRDPNNALHGRPHWLDVSNIAGAYASLNSTDILGAQAFGLIHDCCRKNDHEDYQHGHRAGKWILTHPKINKLLGLDRTKRIAEACAIHTSKISVTDPFLGTCLDADRTTLHRVGLKLDLNYFSTSAGRAYVTKGQTHTTHDQPGFTITYHGSHFLPKGETPQARNHIIYTALDTESAEFYGPHQTFFCSFQKLADLRDPMGILKTPIFDKIKEYQNDEFKGDVDGNNEPLDIFSMLEAGDLYHKLNRRGQENFLQSVLSWGYDAVLFNDISHSQHPTLVLSKYCSIQPFQN